MLIAHNAAEQHAALVDRDTAMHAGIGVMAGLLGISVTAAVLTSLGVEFAYLAAQRGARRAAFDKVEPASSIANHASDVIATVGGVYVGRWIVRRFSPSEIPPASR
jgi:hypothetical protein